MIYLHTGAPGNGKSLYSIWHVKQRAEEENRPVYYHGIKGLKLGWIELVSPHKWIDVPDGSIVVIDECQSTWRPRIHGTSVPESISAMETHRHRGIDIYLITQHPMLLDSNIRRLVGKHRHIVRIFGMQAANIHEWDQVRESPDKSRAGSVETKWVYPKDVYSLYDSAVLHTHKARIPARVFFLLLIPVLIVGLAWGVINWMQGKGKAAKEQTAASAPIGKPVNDSEGKPMTASEYISARTPRVPDFAFTAPVYDEITKPVIAPIPAVCYTFGNVCKCRTQQGTPYQVQDSTCRQIVKTGIFYDWDTRGLVREPPQIAANDKKDALPTPDPAVPVKTAYIAVSPPPRQLSQVDLPEEEGSYYHPASREVIKWEPWVP